MEQRFLKEFKVTCKNSGESELKQLKCDIGSLCTEPFIVDMLDHTYNKERCRQVHAENAGDKLLYNMAYI